MADAVVKDWTAVAKSAGQYGIRYRTDAALEAFLSELGALSQAGAGGVDAVALALEPKCRAFTGGANQLAMNVARELAEVAVAALAASPSAGEDSLHHVTGERITRKDLNNAYRSGQENGRMAAHLLDGIAVDLKPGWLKRDTANAAARVAEWDSVSEYVDGYEFRGDQDYTPNDHERALIEDAICGYVASLPTPPAPVQTASVEADTLGECCDGYEAQIAILQQVISDRDAMIASLTAPTQGDGEPGEGMAEMGEIARIVGEWRHGPMLSPEALRQIAAVATPSSPVSSPSPAGGVRQALEQVILLRVKALETPPRSAMKDFAIEELRFVLGRIAALSSPATGEVVEALREARNYVDDALADAERDLGGVLNYPTLRAQKQAWVDTVKADLAKIDAALNPAPGHGEGVPVAGGEDHG